MIPTQRLDLRAVSPAFLQASLQEDHGQADAILGATTLPDWYEAKAKRSVKRRLGEMLATPALQPWLMWAVILRETNTMIGYVGFHTAPNPEYLKEIAPGGVEFGYTIFPDYRRQGYAREASQGLMQWAHTVHGVRSFVLSISPQNTPSLRIAEGLGFTRIGEHMDEVDGLEYIFRRDLEA